MSQPEPTQRNSPVELAPVVLAPGGVPDIYIDGIQVNASYVGVNLLLQRGMPPNGVPHIVGIVHMSPTASVLARSSVAPPHDKLPRTVRGDKSSR